MILFENKRKMEEFFKQSVKPEIREKVEWCKFENYDSNPVIFTAEHAFTKVFQYKKLGENARLVFGDTNTGWLARIAAFYLRSCYIIPRFQRIDADAARNPVLLSKGTEYRARVLNGDRPFVRVVIHKNKKYLPYLQYYHKIIENLEPKAILSIHGMDDRPKSKYDILLGFGKNKRYILGTKNAFKFRKEFVKRLTKAIVASDLLEQGGGEFAEGIKVGVSKSLFTGESNYILNKFVGQFNERHESKRIGVHVEFTRRGRISKKKIPCLEFQLAVQVLAQMLGEWIKGSSLF
jgi:hypothetical protein